MCGRFALAYEFDELPQQIAKHKSLDPAPTISKDARDMKDDVKSRSYNIPPTKFCPVLNATDNQLYFMRWGLIPAFSDEPLKYTTFNARIESLKRSSIWKKPMEKHQYCAVPMSGYFEWRKTADKQPFYLKRKDNKVMFIAGLYERKREDDDSEHYSFTLITSSAPKGLEWLHARMPIILEPGTKKWNDWLQHGQITNAEFDPDLYEYYPVSREVGKVGNDNADLIVKKEETRLTPEKPATKRSRSKKEAAEGNHDVLKLFGKRSRKVEKSPQPVKEEHGNKRKGVKQEDSDEPHNKRIKTESNQK
ncbi:hypothetical protein ACO0RG_001223 [Hanseniaspora osmophila]